MKNERIKWTKCNEEEIDCEVLDEWSFGALDKP